MNKFDCLSYDKASGSFTWRTHKRTAMIGKSAGHAHNKGYLRIRIEGKSYLAHRLVWFFENGHFPEFFLDHINGDRLDNRIENLRAASYELNAQNKRKPYKNNKSGYMGVRWSISSKAWQASIRHKGKSHVIGVFDCAEDAHHAYLNAKRKLHKGCTI